MASERVTRVNLVKRGVQSLKDAEKSLLTGDTTEAKIEVEIATAYARLAEALGNDAFTERQSGVNW